MCAYVQKLTCLAVAILLMGLAPLSGQAAENQKNAEPATSRIQTGKERTGGSPAVRLREWKSSTDDEQRAFLFGFVTMLELEKEWQGKKPVSPSRSLISCWTKGLNGVSPRQMGKTIDAYVAAHPEDNDMQVVEILWFQYVHPKLTPQELAELRVSRARNK